VFDQRIGVYPINDQWVALPRTASHSQVRVAHHAN